MTMTGGGGLVSAAPGTNTVHIKGAKVPGNESSTERKFHRTFVPKSEKARERKGQGTNVPGSELARVILADSLRGGNWPGSKKAGYPGWLHTKINVRHRELIFWFTFSLQKVLMYLQLLLRNQPRNLQNSLKLSRG